MPSATLPDLEELLSPIAGENPCGVDLRSGTLFNQIRENRKTRRAPLGNQEIPPDWDTVVELCYSGLSKSKDLELAAFLTEAWTHRDSFAGLSRGFRLINQFIELYWDNLYPSIVDGDLEGRASPLAMITAEKSGARLPGFVREIELVVSSAESVIFSAQQWRLLQKRASDDSSERAQLRQTSQEILTQFEKAIVATPPAHLQQLIAEMDQCKVELEKFRNHSLKLFPSTLAPGPHALLESLDDCERLVHQFLLKKGIGQDEPSESLVAASNGTVTIEGNGAFAPHPAHNGGPISSRRDAFRRLNDVAQYFKKHEPQTPVLPLIERALRWESKSLDEVFAEIIKNPDSLTQVFEVLGVQK